jgi:AraC family transcriptional activator of mtrCDE
LEQDYNNHSNGIQTATAARHDLTQAVRGISHRGSAIIHSPHDSVEDPKDVRDHPLVRISDAELDSLLATLEVDFVKLAECLVSPGWRLALDGTNASSIHYNLAGAGRMIIGDQPPIDLLPHTLIIVPQGQPIMIEEPTHLRPVSNRTTAVGRLQDIAPGAFRKFVAGDGGPHIMLICGYFRASYGGSIDLFAPLSSAIVEHFDFADQLDDKLKLAMAELIAQEAGMRAMAAALLKQVLVTLLRRSLSSMNLWVERFSILGDPQIARAFADMAARPGFSHSVQSLARRAGLSRSAFMARFTQLLGKSPMVTLRDLRMRKAARLLTASNFSVDQVAHCVGYKSRSSFFRAFLKIYGNDPSDYRAAAHRQTRQ